MVCWQNGEVENVESAFSFRDHPYITSVYGLIKGSENGYICIVG